MNIRLFRSFVTAYLERISRQIAAVDAKLNQLLATKESEMAVLDELVDAVAAQTTVIESGVTLIDGLAEKLAAAGVDPAKLDELKAAIEANTDKLAGAIARNTSAEDELHAEGM